MLDTLVMEIRQLPLLARLALVEIITESVREELANAPTAAANVTPGMLRPEGKLPTAQELPDDYTNYLIEKYKY